MTIMRHGRRLWRVLDDDGSLVCVTAYRKGAKEVVRRLTVARQTSAAARELFALAREAAVHPLTLDGPRVDEQATAETAKQTTEKDEPKKGEQ